MEKDRHPVPRTHIAIIGAPLDLGQDRRGVDMGPSAVRVANLHARVASLGYEVEDWGNIHVEQKEAWPEGDPRAKYLALIASTCEVLATRVGEALQIGRASRRVSDWSSDVCSSDLYPRRTEGSMARGRPARQVPGADRLHLRGAGDAGGRSP